MRIIDENSFHLKFARYWLCTLETFWGRVCKGVRHSGRTEEQAAIILTASCRGALKYAFRCRRPMNAARVWGPGLIALHNYHRNNASLFTQSHQPCCAKRVSSTRQTNRNQTFISTLNYNMKYRNKLHGCWKILITDNKHTYTILKYNSDNQLKF